MNENYQPYGSQDLTLSEAIEIVRQISGLSGKETATYNECTETNDGRYYLTVVGARPANDGKDTDVMGLWASTQNLSETAYETINWLLIPFNVRIILPPIKP